MDSNNKEIRPKKHDEKSLEKLESKIVFNNDPRYSFIFKKTEKIVAALYLVTNLIKDTEPLKQKIRETALTLLSQTISFQSVEINNKKSSVVGVATILSEVSSLLKIGYLSHYISEMNYAILIKELSLLLDTFDSYVEESGQQNSGVLSQDFFALPEVHFTQTAPMVRPLGSDLIYKGHSVSDKNVKDKSTQPKEKDAKKSDRRQVILKLLKDSKVLSIKEFSKQIKDCSEKTIQRELLALVQEGVLNKKGERRWSTYSLTSQK